MFYGIRVSTLLIWLLSLISISLFRFLFLSIMAANPTQVDRAFSVTNIKSHILLILDLDDHNYDAWAIQLDNEQRTREIGDMIIETYRQKLKSLSQIVLLMLMLP